MMHTTNAAMDAPDWFTQRAEELMRLMSSSPKSVADGLWFELISRGLIAPEERTGVPDRALSWRQTATTSGITSTRLSTS
jgi:hypothetical protein